MENDGDAVMGEIIGELAGEGEGFGAEDVAVLGNVKVAVAQMRGVGEQGAESRIPGAGTGAEDGLGVVEENGGGRAEAHAGDEGRGGEGGGEGGILAEQAEKLQAESFAGLGLGGEAGEVGSELGGGRAPGVEDPEGEKVALVLGAVEIAADEGGEVVE